MPMLPEQVTVLESIDQIGGHVHTDYSFGCPIDMGASWLHGVSNENSLAPLIGHLGLRLYHTSGDNSVLYDHDLESCSLFDKNGLAVPMEIAAKVGVIFEKILKEKVKPRDEQEHDMRLEQAISMVLERHPDLKRKVQIDARVIAPFTPCHRQEESADRRSRHCSVERSTSSSRIHHARHLSRPILRLPKMQRLALCLCKEARSTDRSSNHRALACPPAIG